MNRVIPAIALFVLFTVSVSSNAAEKVALFPLESVGGADATAEAIELRLGSTIGGAGFIVSNIEADDSDAREGVGAEPDNREADDEADDRSETASDPAETARALAARFYITGSIVRLGEETTIALELYAVDGRIVSAKKVVARTEQELPRAVETIGAHVVKDMKAALTPPAPPPRAAAPVAPRSPETEASTEKNGLEFHKNFGVFIAQAFSVKEEMYGFTAFGFNGRFEFNRLMLAIDAGFGMGNKHFEDGFHFNLDLALAAYLRKGQVTPYIGGGVGLFIGNRLDGCGGSTLTTLDYDGDSSHCFEDDDLVGWQVFPMLGVEVLRTFSLRLHFEVRYLIAFNADKNWGHGPMPLIGIAF